MPIHPLDAVESELIDAVNALDAVMHDVEVNSDVKNRLEPIWDALTAVLTSVQDERERDLDALERS